MLESINWIRDYFDQSPDAVMIFQNDGLVLSNRLAQHLTNQIGRKQEGRLRPDLRKSRTAAADEN